MGVVEEAFSRLFPNQEFNFTATVNYSGKFKPYNATVRKIGSSLRFSLSRSWRGVSDEIVIGLIQHLLVKILRREKFFIAAAAAAKKGNDGSLASLNMQLYDDFIKGISDITVTASNSSNCGRSSGSSADEALKASFDRVNEKYFFSVVDQPNLKWGSGSFRKLASYDYHTNTVTVSSLFSGAPERLLDYLMHHEMLHKKIKFSSCNGRAVHHGAEFKKIESRFENRKKVEDEVNAFIRMTLLRKGSIQKRAGSFKKRFDWRRILLLR